MACAKRRRIHPVVARTTKLESISRFRDRSTFRTDGPRQVQSIELRTVFQTEHWDGPSRTVHEAGRSRCGTNGRAAGRPPGWMEAHRVNHAGRSAGPRYLAYKQVPFHAHVDHHDPAALECRRSLGDCRHIDLHRRDHGKPRDLDLADVATVVRGTGIHLSAKASDTMLTTNSPVRRTLAVVSLSETAPRVCRDQVPR